MTKGLDLSEHNRGVKIKDVKNLGWQFAILRAGYTGYGEGRMKRKDALFESYYKQAKDCGLPVGAYWYSCCNDKASGRAEAEFMYENCLKGKQFEYPIYIDIEDQRWQMKNPKGVTDGIIAFCETLEAKGYFVGIYSSTYWFKTYLQIQRLEAYSKWIANWSSKKPEVKFSGFDMWQNSSTGKVSGYTVDTNIAYKDFKSIIKAAGLNGFKKAAKPKKKTVEEIAKEVIDGKWGNGDERKKKLTEAGYNYATVQKKVNQLMKG